MPAVQAAASRTQRGGPDAAGSDGRARVRARVLGGFSLSVDGRAIGTADWQRLSAQRLVKLLLVTPGHRLPREQAAEILWPDADPATSGAKFRKAVHFAGRALDGAGVLQTAGRWIALDGSGVDLDLDRLESALASLALGSSEVGPSAPAPGSSVGVRPASASPDRGVALQAAVATVLDLGGSELLPDDMDEDWLVGPRERLKGAWRRLALDAARRAHALGRTAEAHEIVARVLAADATDEAAHRLAIELYLSEGRHHAARRQLEICRQALREQLDLEPSPETVEVGRAIERARPRPGSAATQAPRLVGRRSEVERVESILDRVAGGRLATLVLRGPAGIGKTRLLQEVAAYARSTGWLVLEWQAIEPLSGVAFAPLRAGLAQSLAGGALETLVEPGRSAILAVQGSTPDAGVIPFENRPALVAAVVDALDQLARRRPLVLVWDDFQWLDASSTDVLRAVAASLPASPILLAVAHRDDERLPESATAFLDQVRHSGALEVALTPLGQRDVEALIVEHLGGQGLAPELARDVFEQGRGNPLFCLELVRAGRERGVVQLLGERWTRVDVGASLDVPESVRHLVATRSARLAGGARELLAVAAELGADFAFDTLQAVFEGQSIVRTVDDVIGSGLLVERGVGYAFAHPLYRRAVQGQVGRSRRGPVHLAIARALAGRALAELDAGVGVELGREPAGRSGAVALEDGDTLNRVARECLDPDEIAAHALTAAELGARAALPLAVAFGFSAGERARRLFDRRAATSFLERALAAWCRLAEPVARRFDASSAWIALATVRTADDEEQAATEAFQAAIAAARTPEELAEAYVSYAWLPYRHGGFEAALGIYREGRARLPPDADLARANLQREIGWTLLRLWRLDEAFEPLGQAVTTLGPSGDRRGAMRALDAIGCYHEYRKELDRAIEEVGRSLAIALETRDARGEFIARTHLASSIAAAGHPLEARAQIERALELGRMIGDQYMESVASWIAAAIEDTLGNWSAAMAHRRRELELLSTIGGNPTNEALAHAHLALLARHLDDRATADAEAAEARRLAAFAEEPGYAARIEEVLAARRWSEVPA